jgi:hypothetical protein
MLSEGFTKEEIGYSAEPPGVMSGSTKNSKLFDFSYARYSSRHINSPMVYAMTVNDGEIFDSEEEMESELIDIFAEHLDCKLEFVD